MNMSLCAFHHEAMAQVNNCLQACLGCTMCCLVVVVGVASYQANSILLSSHMHTYSRLSVKEMMEGGGNRHHALRQMYNFMRDKGAIAC